METCGENKVLPLEMENIPTENKRNNLKVQKSCLNHILVAMTISGCYNRNISGDDRTFYRKFISIYRMFIFIMLLLHMVKVAAGFQFISKSDYPGHGIVLAWNAYCLSNFLLAFRMNHPRIGNQENTFNFWNETIVPQMTNLGIKFNHFILRRKQIYMCISALIIITMLVSFCVLQISGLLGSGNTGMLTIPFEKTYFTMTFQTVLVLVCGMQGIVPWAYMVIICGMLIHSFDIFKQSFKAEMCRDACRLPHQIQAFRQLHANLCTAVYDFDKDFKYLLGNIAFCNTGLSLFILYVLVKGGMVSMGIIGTVSYISWLLLSMGALVIMSVCAALVHEAVR